MVNGAKGAYPTAKESSQKNCQHHGYKSPQEAPVKCLGAEHGRNCNQGIELKQPVDWPASQLPPPHSNGSNDAKPDEKKKEKYLSYASNGYNSHEILKKV